MTAPQEAVEAASRHLDTAHDLLARAKTRWDPAGSCPCGPKPLRDALESVDHASRQLQEVLHPVPGD